MAARRSAIMTSAREMLAEKNVADISLRELSDRVGLAKSNVLRYFDSREAIFLEVLDEEFQAWLTDLDDPARQAAGEESRLCQRDSGGDGDRRLAGGHGNCSASCSASMAGVLERNISVDFARDFKARAMANESPRWRNSSRGNCRGCPASSPSSSPRAR